MQDRHHVALDGWRGLAALSVALFHFQATSSVQAAPLLRNAWLFVDFFFVLSGFVIAANYRERLARGYDVSAFLLLRLGRLYPLHLVMMLAFVGTELILLLGSSALTLSGRPIFSGQTAPVGILTNLALIQGMGFHDDLTWNGVAWSISTEFWAYVVFAMIAARAGGKLAWPMLAVIVVSLVFVLPASLRPAGLLRFVDFARCLYGFALGVLLDIAYTNLVRSDWGKRFGFWQLSVLELATTVLMLGFVALSNGMPVHVLAPLAFAPAILVFAFDGGAISRVLQRPFVRTLGLLSYSIYMIHPFIQSRVMLPAGLLLQKLTGLAILSSEVVDGVRTPIWGHTPWQGNLWVIAMCALTIACSLASYRLIEEPGRRAMRNWLARREATTDDAALQRSAPVR